MITTNSSHSPQIGTPALTPSSGTLSYTSGHSPTSVPGLSPPSSSRNDLAGPAIYPTLPAVSSVYPSHSNTAPVSTLGTNFDNDPRKRFSGGMLQRSAGSRAREETVESEASTPSPKQSSLVSNRSEQIDPTLSGVSSPSPQSDTSEAARDRAEEVWVENIRVIEALRKFIADRLERKEYDEDNDDDDNDVEMADSNDEMPKLAEDHTRGKAEHENLYPVLRAAIDAAT